MFRLDRRTINRSTCFADFGYIIDGKLPGSKLSMDGMFTPILLEFEFISWETPTKHEF